MKKVGVSVGVLTALLIFGGCQKVGEVLNNPTATKVIDTAKEVVNTLAKPVTGGNGEKSGGLLGGWGGGGLAGRLFPIAQPLFLRKLVEDDFSQYGLGQRAPFGPWTGDGAVIKMAVQRDKMSGKIMETTRDGEAVCISEKVAVPKNFYLRTYFIPRWTAGDILFRNREDLGVGYLLRIRRDWGDKFRVTLLKKAGTQYAKIAENMVKLPGEDWRELEIMAEGDNIKVSVARQQVLDIRDRDPNLQAPGRICFGGSGSRFDDVLIYNLRPQKTSQ
jgi:hypothetical protein